MESNIPTLNTLRSLSATVEAIMFTSGEPVAVSKLADILNVSEEEIGVAIDALDAEYHTSGRGLSLIGKDGMVLLVTHPDCALAVESFVRKEREGTLSRAALETLSIVAYRGPVSRTDIESIRGVNCTLSLRNLLLRGLVERRGNPDDTRGYLYSVSFAFLETIGLSDISELPEYETLSKDSRLETVVPDPILNNEFVSEKK